MRLREWTAEDAAWYAEATKDPEVRRWGNMAVDVEGGVGHVSYLVAADARGRGLATRALTEFVAWIFANHEVTELRLWAHRDNAGSRRVAERAGFVRDPSRDQAREIKGAVWPTVSYQLVP